MSLKITNPGLQQYLPGVTELIEFWCHLGKDICNDMKYLWHIAQEIDYKFFVIMKLFSASTLIPKWLGLVLT